nr:immunoglobulin heavy chain junction region [Macaca mulatta]MOW79091.1 immunoglobulin heavy chain junction region [Macaca mulatta]
CARAYTFWSGPLDFR